MRRPIRSTVFIVLAALLILAWPRHATYAQSLKTYRSDAFGVTFQYPADWVLREQPPTQSLVLSSDVDAKAIQAGQEPSGLIFSLTFSSFRQLGVDRIDQLGDQLKRITGTPDVAPEPDRIGGADGLSVDVLDGKAGVAGRSSLLSIGRRRVAVVRGLATIKGWVSGGIHPQYDSILKTLSFFPPENADQYDHLGRILWQAADPGFGTIADLSSLADDSAVLASDSVHGIFTVSANGVVTGSKAYDQVGAYGSLALFRDGTRYIADPSHHVIWLVQPGGTPKKLLGGTTGTARGQFGDNSPRVFTFGYDNTLNILDESSSGTRIQVFGRGGDVLTAWPIDPVQEGAITADPNGYVYVVGKNTPGVIKISASGKVVAKELGKAAINGAQMTAIAVDRFGNLYIATTDSGVLKLNADGQLQGIIGEPYDQAAPPKPGQLGGPTALALAEGDNILYIADGGKYPQIVAVALNGNATINFVAGTKALGPISYGQSLSGEITAAAFVNTYTFEGKAGDLVTITMRAADGTNLDAFVDLLGTDGQRVAANDDAKLSGAKPTDAQISGYKLPYNGTYTIRATRFGRETTTATGGYTLSLEKQ